MSYVWQKLVDDWTTLTDVEKENLFLATEGYTPTVEELSTLGNLKVAVYNTENTTMNTKVEGVPSDKLMLGKDFVTEFSSIDGINAKEERYGGDIYLLHFNNTLEDSIAGNVWNQGGTITFDTSNKKFGTASAVFDGSSYLYTDTPESLDFSDKDFTIEMFIYPTNNSSRQVLFRIGFFIMVELFNGGTNNANMAISPSMNNDTWAIDPSSNGKGLDNLVQMNEWNHIALVRYGNVFTLYVNGQVSVSATLNRELTFLYGSAFGKSYIGSSFGNNNFIGNIDDVRISKGLAHYTSTFSVPTAELEEYKMPQIKFALTKDDSTYYTFNESLITKTTTTNSDSVTALVCSGQYGKADDVDSWLDMSNFTIDIDFSTTVSTTQSSSNNAFGIFDIENGDYGTILSPGYFLIGVNSGNLACVLYKNDLDYTGREGNTFSDTYVADGKKHTVTVSYNNNWVAVYLDRNLVYSLYAENLFPSSVAGYDFKLFGGFTNNLSGNMYNCRIYNYKLPKCYMGLNENVLNGCIAKYSGDSLSGSTLEDLSGNSHNMSIAGSGSMSKSTVTMSYDSIIETIGFTTLVDNNVSTIVTNGISAEVLNNIDDAQWKLFYTSSDTKIKYAIALAQEDSSQICNIDNLSMYGDFSNVWSKAIHGTDYTYSYISPTKSMVNLLTNGDYKINYQE